MHTLFANTGVQIICVPLSGRRYATAQIGYGWQYCQIKDPDPDSEDDPDAKPKNFPYIQWQIVQANVSKLYLAVDTTLGDPQLGYFCDPTTLAGDFEITIENLLDLAGEVLQGIPSVELRLRAATATAAPKAAIAPKSSKPTPPSRSACAPAPSLPSARAGAAPRAIPFSCWACRALARPC